MSHHLQKKTPESPDLVRRVKNWVTVHKDELAIATLVLALSTVLTFLVNGGANPVWIIATVNVAMMVLLVLQRASVSHAISRLRDIVTYELRASWYETVYGRRQHHFFDEKRLLASHMAEDVLPYIVTQILEARNGAQIRLVLDSGTTITPIFDELLSHGVVDKDRNQVKTIEIITNNLAGIDHIQGSFVGSPSHLTEMNFILLGGNPLATYRATTGAVTEQSLRGLLTKKGVVSIGVLTANWLLIGRAHNSLKICARGRGHLTFKKEMADLCDYVIVVAPLGKIFSLDGIHEVDGFMQKHGGPVYGPNDGYEEFRLSDHKKLTTILVTTQRPAGSNSPLAALSGRLFDLPSGSRQNFTVVDRPVIYSPFGSRDEVRRVELPHLWTRGCTDKLFGEPR